MFKLRASLNSMLVQSSAPEERTKQRVISLKFRAPRHIWTDQLADTSKNLPIESTASSISLVQRMGWHWTSWTKFLEQVDRDPKKMAESDPSLASRVETQTTLPTLGKYHGARSNDLSNQHQPQLTAKVQRHLTATLWHLNRLL